MKEKLRLFHVIQLLHFTFIILHFTFQKITVNHIATFTLIILPVFSFSQNKNIFNNISIWNKTEDLRLACSSPQPPPKGEKEVWAFLPNGEATARLALKSPPLEGVGGRKNNRPLDSLNLPLTKVAKKTNKITHLLEGGVLAGAEIARNTGDFKYAPNLRYTFLYQATPHLQVGGGVAYEQFSRETLLPVYADAHIYMRETVNSPFFAIQAGYAAAGWHKDYRQLEQYRYKGDLMLNIDYGQRRSLNDNLAFHISAGLHFQTTRIQVNLDYSDKYTERVNYVLVALKAGIAF